MAMKLELGGGNKYARGEGWTNIDQCEGADIRHNLDVVPWPLADESVQAVYSSHCLEHLKDPHQVFRELCRVCVVGAPIEIRVPHPRSDLAMCAGHLHVYSPVQCRNEDHYFAADFWTGPKRMKLDRLEYHPTYMLEEAKAELPFLKGLSDELIMKWIGGTCHECRFFFNIVANEVKS
jgi:ubiquinone/menaquinone biosynthesis C-methylase UbiE